MVLLLGALGALTVAIVLAVVALAGGSSTGGGVAGALAVIENGYSRTTPDQPPARRSFETAPGWLRSLVLRLSPDGIEARLQRRLDLAGNPPAWTPDRVLAVKGFALFAVAGVGVLLGSGALLTVVLYGSAGAAAGFFLPDLLLLNAGQKRQAKIRDALPDALDMLTVCVEAGLGFDAALAQVARNTRGPLAAEFARVLQETQLGTSRTQALRATAERTTVAELRTFVSALVQAGELGVPIGRVLREQAKGMRVRRRQRAEERAQKVPVKILFPLVVCLFPAIFVVILGPGAISIMRSLF
ncbi:type II secretion system F family protein [Saccharothrix sp. NPDC042600]|uniref:type II secretion system F family protein n=1 Tax=Saccharothrix TaxID=2071 RepID=UPI00341112F8|nr:type II secretion system F family protein [Saccharothrix mutabilis subsp. capreolus]